jgi:hypothetical protein
MIAMGLWVAALASCQTGPAESGTAARQAAKDSAGGFRFEDNGQSLTLLEDGKPVLTYRYTFVEPPAGVDGIYRRMSYIHPLYGLDGDVLTQDFPDDHYHHRGIFWAWPRCAVGERPMDVWLGTEAKQIFDRWVARKAEADTATFAVENLWVFDDRAPKVRERAGFIVHRANDLGRAIDVCLKFTNVCDEVVTIRGATEQNKGYGGLCYRPDAARKPMMFTTAQGGIDADQTEYDTPWADCTSAAPNGPESGLAIFQHPGNPGYPHSGWLFRHYGFLGASYPHNETLTLNPGDSFEVRYRLYVHRGNAASGQVAEQFAQYTEAMKQGGAEP